MELLSAFGIDWRLITIQVVNFVILVAALTYLLYKPVLKVVSEREAVIKKGVEDARAAEASRGKAEEERRQILIKAENDARVTREKAKQAADVERGNILRDAETQRARILNDAEVRGNEEVAASLRQAEKEAARLAILASEKLIREKL